MNGRPFTSLRSDGLSVLLAPRLAALPWLVHGFSTRLGGVSSAPAEGLNLGRGAAHSRGAAENRKLFLRALGVAGFSVASLKQIHSAAVFAVAKDGSLEFRPSGYDFCSTARRKNRGDALITRSAGVLLEIRTADCLPVLLADPLTRAVAAVHAGWRGALERVVEKTVGEMRRLYHSRPDLMLAALGPSIRACCYEVGDEVVEAFTGAFVHSERYFVRSNNSASQSFPGMPFLSLAPPGHARPQGSGFSLDLAAAARGQLLAAGLKPGHIEDANLCTSCHPDVFYSYRRDGALTGRMAAVIGMRA